MATPLGGESSTLQTLVAVQAAKSLKARYFRLMDTKDWDGWEALYAASAVLDMRGEAAAMRSIGMDVGDGEEWLLRSRGVIRQSVEAALADVTTVHHGHMAEINLVAPNRIEAIWAMEDVLRYPPGGPVAGFNGYGHYHDSYVFEDGRWLIESVTLKRLLISPIPTVAG